MTARLRRSWRLDLRWDTTKLWISACSEAQALKSLDDMHSIRQAARESLLEAAENGNLERVVSELKAGKDGDSCWLVTLNQGQGYGSAREQAAELLQKACLSH